MSWATPAQLQAGPEPSEEAAPSPTTPHGPSLRRFRLDDCPSAGSARHVRDKASAHLGLWLSPCDGTG